MTSMLGFLWMLLIVLDMARVFLSDLYYDAMAGALVIFWSKWAEEGAFPDKPDADLMIDPLLEFCSRTTC